jgi:hypothetical protein
MTKIMPLYVFKYPGKTPGPIALRLHCREPSFSLPARKGLPQPGVFSFKPFDPSAAAKAGRDYL